MLCEEIGTAYSMLLEQELDCRIAQNNDRRNGSYERRLLSSIGDIVVSIPRGRHTSVADVLCKYQRRLDEFDAIVISSVLFGHSMRHTAKFMAQLCENSGVSRSTVSSIMKTLDGRAQTWRDRPLTKPYAYLWLDAKVVKVAGAMKRPSFVVAALGATVTGEQEILGFAVCSSESEAQWSAFLRSLVDRGLDPAKLALVIRDGAKGCEEAILTVLGLVPQQSCCVHLSRHALDRVDRDHRKPFAKGLRSIFEAPTRPQAQR